MFQPILREKLRLRMALIGPPKSGKTYTALRQAFLLAGPSGRVAVIDSEHASARKYVGISPDGIPWRWEGVELEYFAPATYQAAIEEAGRVPYDVLVIDSLSHAWIGKGGSLDQVDRAPQSSDPFGGWRTVSPQQTALVDAILSYPGHVIATLRTKVAWVIERNEKGKKAPRKVGTKTVMKEGMEYEFDIVGTLDSLHNLVVQGRCPAVEGRTFSLPGSDLADPIRAWLSEAPEAPAAPAPAAPVAPEPEAAPPATAAAAGGLVLDASPVAGELCDESTAKAIVREAKALGWGPAEIAKVLAPRGVSKLRELPMDAAAGLLKHLRGKVLEAEGAAAF